MTWNTMLCKEFGLNSKKSTKKQLKRQKEEWAEFRKRHPLVEKKDHNGYRTIVGKNKSIGE